jgi:hypothetical protein
VSQFDRVRWARQEGLDEQRESPSASIAAEPRGDGANAPVVGTVDHDLLAVDDGGAVEAGRSDQRGGTEGGNSAATSSSFSSTLWMGGTAGRFPFLSSTATSRHSGTASGPRIGSRSARKTVRQRPNRHGNGRRCPIQQLPSAGLDPALHDGVHPWHPDSALDDARSGIGRHGIEAGGELGVPIADEERDRTAGAYVIAVYVDRTPVGEVIAD